MRYKIGIITIYDAAPNYGNKLQNYATKTLLEKLGHSAFTIVTEPQQNFIKIRIKLLLNAISLYKLRGKKAQLDWKKMIVFDLFNRRYLSPKYDEKKIITTPNTYDFYAIGSDQVWNPEWYSIYPPKKDLFLLSFASIDQKLCISPSFGVSELQDNWKEWFKNNLLKFKEISVREEAGALIIKQLTEKDASVLIDPTLMLDKDDWIKIAHAPSNIEIKEKYILTYFIGGIREDVKNYIKTIANEHSLKVINLLDYEQPEIFLSGPKEFVYLIAHSSLIFTDSFHACVFSIIFGKPFRVFNRNGTKGVLNSRIDTLLNKLNLDRKAEWSTLPNELFEANYNDSYQLLKTEKDKAISFILRNLN